MEDLEEQYCEVNHEMVLRILKDQGRKLKPKKTKKSSKTEEPKPTGNQRPKRDVNSQK